MRAVILVAGLPPNYNGGTEIATEQIAKYAVKSGHEVHIIALDGKNKPYQDSNGYKVHTIKTLSIPYLYGLVALPSVVFNVLKIRPDVVHAQGSQIGISAFVASLITKTPYILYGRGEIYVDWFLKSFMTKLLMKHASRVIAQTEHMKREMAKYVNRDIEVIPNGIDVGQFGKVSRIEARKQLCLPLDSNIVIWVGNDRPEKNLLCFLKVSNLIFSDKVYPIVVTNKSYEDVKLYMCAADVLVNTSLSEGFPMTVLEAMASGLPIVAPSVCGIPEIVEHGINGALVESNNYVEFANAVNLLVSDYEVAGRISKENKIKAKSYTWQNVIKKLYGDK